MFLLFDLLNYTSKTSISYTRFNPCLLRTIRNIVELVWCGVLRPVWCSYRVHSVLKGPWIWLLVLSPWIVLEFLNNKNSLNQSRNAFFIFINTTMWVKKHEVRLGTLFNNFAKVFAAFFSILKIMQGAVARLGSFCGACRVSRAVTCVLHNGQIWTNMHGWVIFNPWKITNCPWILIWWSCTTPVLVRSISVRLREMFVLTVFFCLFYSFNRGKH